MKAIESMKSLWVLGLICLAVTACASQQAVPVTSKPAIAAAAARPTENSLSSVTPAVSSPKAIETSGSEVSQTSEPGSSPRSVDKTASGVPVFEHVVLIVLENQDYSKVIGSSKMPNLNDLAKSNVLLSDYYAVRHPSLPNYIALMSGNTQGITSDCTDCFVKAPNLADKIDAGGRTWKAYLEDLPSPCYVGDRDPYVQKHNPLVYFDSIRQNPERCQKGIVPLPQLQTDLAANALPNFAFVMPNLCNSGHDCSRTVADDWVKTTVEQLQASPALGKKYLIAIVYDEASDSDTASCCGLGGEGGGHIAAVLISPLAKPGFTDDTQYSHYSLLKTILRAWNLPDLGKTADPQTAVIRAPWK
jgi:hypothetical protein